MTHFQGTIAGSAQYSITRAGPGWLTSSKSSGIWSHTRGRNIGAIVRLEHTGGKDFLLVFVTGKDSMSNGKQIIKMAEDEPIPALKEAVEIQECPHCGAVLGRK